MTKNCYQRVTSWSSTKGGRRNQSDEDAIMEWYRAGKGKPNRETRRAMERKHRKLKRRATIGLD